MIEASKTAGNWKPIQVAVAFAVSLLIGLDKSNVQLHI
jgi:hypothetical protein